MIDPLGKVMTGLHMSPREMARYGLAILAGGAWAGEQLIGDKSYLDDSINTSQEMNPSYGYLWWLNGKSSVVLPGPKRPQRDGSLIPHGPSDVAAALGAMDKKIYVSRSTDLVVTRHGGAGGDRAAALSNFDDDLWRLLMAAAPR